MSGVTKRIYEGDIYEINIMWNKQVNSIKGVLPIDYSKKDVLAAVQKFYPHEWKGVEYKKKYYDEKDKFLRKRLGAARYNMPEVQTLFYRNRLVNNICNDNIRRKYSLEFDENARADIEKNLWNKRKTKIKRIDDKITCAKAKTQSVTPMFIDQLIGLYERKSTSQKDKVYIIFELMKYYNPRVITFFFKINDTELNRQLREIAFKHLQSFNYAPRLRRQKYMQIHTRNKKRKAYLENVYPYETYHIPHDPDELEYRIRKGKEQQIKKYDFFISHSSKDSEFVQHLIDYENSIGKYVFCDWINDADYLKRELLRESTLRVIENRLENSDAVIFVKSDNSLNSDWCTYELNYFYTFNKNIFYVDIDDIIQKDYKLKHYDEIHFLNGMYRNLKLIEKDCSIVN